MEAEGAAGKADVRIKFGRQGKPHKFEILNARVKALRKRVRGTRILCACVGSKLVDMERSVSSMHASVFLPTATTSAICVQRTDLPIICATPQKLSYAAHQSTLELKPQEV